MFANVNTFACLPRTTRGTPLVLGGDPKGKNFLYPNGNSIVIRDIANPTICDIYTEHSTLTTVAKYSPSGFYIASADQHGKVRIWDTTQKEHLLKNEFQPFAGMVKDLAWSADSQRIVAVGEGRERFAHVFAMETGTSIGEIAGHSKSINSCDFKSSRPFKIITGSEDNTVGIYEGPPFKFKSQLQDHNRFVQAVRFSPDGESFATGGFDGKLFLYNSKDYAKIGEFGSPAHKGGIYALSWSPDGKELLTASGDKTCKIWNVESLSCVVEFTMGTDVLDQQVSCLWQGQYLLSVSLSGFINYLDRNNPGNPLRVIKGHNKSITAFAVANSTCSTCTGDSKESKLLFSGSHDGYVTYWSSDGQQHDRVEGGEQHKNQVQDMSVAGDSLYTCGFDDTLRTIDLNTCRFSDTPIKLTSQPRGLTALTNGGCKIVLIAQVDSVCIYKDGKLCNSHKITGWEPSCIDVTVNDSANQHVAVGGAGNDQKVHVFSFDDQCKLEQLHELPQRGAITAVEYSPNGKYLAAADANRKVFLYSPSDNYQLAHQVEWGFHTARVNCLAWASDSNRLSSGGLDTNIIIWFADKPNKHIMIKHAHLQNQITRVAWIGDDILASSGQDANIRTWSITEK